MSIIHLFQSGGEIGVFALIIVGLVNEDRIATWEQKTFAKLVKWLTK